MRCCFKKQEAQEKELLETVAMVENLVSHKTKSINIVLPVLMTVVTPILTYLFTTKFEFDKVSDIKVIVFIIHRILKNVVYKKRGHLVLYSLTNFNNLKALVLQIW